jgi:cell division protein FtsB
MPVNHWDYLMGDSMKEGHEAEIYTLDDDTEIIQEYDRFLAPRLSLINPQDDFLLNSTGKDDFTSLTKTVETLSQQIKMLLQENSELRKQLTTLSGVL